MIIVLSPAKTLDFSPIETSLVSQPRFLEESNKLVKVLKKKSSTDIQKLMSVSEKIANLNVERYKTFKTPFTQENAKPSMFAFQGDVYTGLEAGLFSKKEIDFAQKHIRILSGLYGVLKPMDLMQPYRLEMGTKLKNGKYKNLYEFWDNRITEVINQDLETSGSEILLNLASNEYFHSIKKENLKGQIINVAFKENRNGALKIISFNAKKARGRMSHLIVKEGITKVTDLKSLVVNDYIFNSELSNESDLVFVKE